MTVPAVVAVFIVVGWIVLIVAIVAFVPIWSKWVDRWFDYLEKKFNQKDV